MQLDYKIIEDFKQLTSKDITSHLLRCSSFFSKEYVEIVDFFSGKAKSLDSGAFKQLNTLELEIKEIFYLIDQNARSMRNSKWWVLTEQIERIDMQLKTLLHINKWARSSLTTVGYSPYVQTEYVLNQNQTLERVARDVLRSQSRDKWVDIAIDNRLEEEDYSSEGGNRLNLYFDRANNVSKINSVIDVIRGKSIYGKDLDKSIHFVVDEDGYVDIATLNYNDTIYQAVDILIKLKKNSNPDSPDSGLQSSIVVGSNRAMLNYPILDRQLSATFATDDSLKNFKLLNLNIEEDKLWISYSVQTRLNETINQKDIITDVT